MNDTPVCIGNDPTCPCQDGDACHYRDIPGSPGWPIAATDPLAVGPSSPPDGTNYQFHWIMADGILTVAKWTTNHWLLPGYTGSIFPAVTQGWRYIAPIIPPEA